MTTMTGYLYDADGTRVAKGRITAWSCDPAVNGFQTTNDYILGLGGEQLTEMGVGTASSVNPASDSNSALTWQHTNVYAAGALIATYDNDGLHFYLNDPLGTRRTQTDYAGVLEQTCSSLPFGDGLSCSGGNLQAPTEHHFTGKERDTESGNDYFGARYYASSMGRWMSPDWSAKIMPVPYAKLDNPQSLNLYIYAGNNPLIHIDADGHCWPQSLCNAVQNAFNATYNWVTSNHSASASASATAGQGSGSAGPLSVDAKAGTAKASASASWKGTDKSASANANASASVAETTINVTSHSTTQVNALTANAGTDAEVSLGGKNGPGVQTSASANADVLTASETGTIKIGPITITGTATGNVGIGANASYSLGASGFSQSLGYTLGYGGALSYSVSWGDTEISGGEKELKKQ
jgi:RHS repeat-associated protein